MRPRIDAARLTQWVTLDAVTGQVADPTGGYVDVFAPLNPPNDYAAVEPAVANQERSLPETTQVSATHVVTLRFRPDITTNVRVTFTDAAGRVRQLWVTGVRTLVEGGEVLQLVCEERPTPPIAAQPTVGVP